MEIATLKDLLIKQMVDLQSTVFNLIPRLPLVNKYSDGEQICKILFLANEQIKELIQNLDRKQQALSSSLQGANTPQTHFLGVQQKNLQCDYHKKKEQKIQIKVTQEPNIDKPCCLCSYGHEKSYGKIITIPNSVRKLQAHQQCYQNIYNPRKTEFDEVYLIFKTYECKVCQKQGASYICEKCNTKYHFPCFVDSCQEGLLLCQCKK